MYIYFIHVYIHTFVQQCIGKTPAGCEISAFIKAGRCCVCGLHIPYECGLHHIIGVYHIGVALQKHQRKLEIQFVE